MRWLKGRVDWEIEIIVDGRGPLLDDFRAIGRTTVWRRPSVRLAALPMRWPAALMARAERWLLRVLFARRRFNVVYANTAATWHLASAVKGTSGLLLWHVHELTYALRLTLATERARDEFRRADRFVAVGEAVRQGLEKEYGIPAGRISLVHAFVPVVPLTDPDKANLRHQVLVELGWPDDAVVIGGCGTLGWRKGTDLFLQIARTIVERHVRDVRFLWVGGSAGEHVTIEFDHDTEALGLEQMCARVPTTADVVKYYAAMDVFAMTSREDPFPLVMLEAGAQRIPTVCFAGSGGGPEFVGCDAGLVAPYLDVQAFADHLLRLIDDSVLRGKMGDAAACKVRQCYSLDNQAPKLLQLLKEATSTGQSDLEFDAT